MKLIFVPQSSATLYIDNTTYAYAFRFDGNQWFRRKGDKLILIGDEVNLYAEILDIVAWHQPIENLNQAWLDEEIENSWYHKIVIA